MSSFVASEHIVLAFLAHSRDAVFFFRKFIAEVLRDALIVAGHAVTVHDGFRSVLPHDVSDESVDVLGFGCWLCHGAVFACKKGILGEKISPGIFGNEGWVKVTGKPSEKEIGTVVLAIWNP